jgi:hypothetical protein
MTWVRVLYIAPPCRSVCGKIIQEMEPTSRRRSHRTKSLLAKNAETPPIPTLLSATEVNALIFPHLKPDQSSTARPSAPLPRRRGVPQLDRFAGVGDLLCGR